MYAVSSELCQAMSRNPYCYITWLFDLTPIHSCIGTSINYRTWSVVITAYGDFHYFSRCPNLWGRSSGGSAISFVINIYCSVLITVKMYILSWPKWWTWWIRQNNSIKMTSPRLRLMGSYVFAHNKNLGLNTFVSSSVEPADSKNIIYVLFFT